MSSPTIELEEDEDDCSVGSGSSSSKRRKLDSSGDYFISKNHVNQMFCFNVCDMCACIIMQKQSGLPNHR